MLACPLTPIHAPMPLPIVSFATLYLRYVHLPKTIVPKGWITLALWIASVVMLVMMGYWVLQRLV